MQATDAAGLVTAYQYEPKFGNKTWEKDPLGNEIFYTYNKFGILTGMQTPLGNTSITRNWVTPVAANLAFTETITTEGKPTTQTWYDILGREVKLKTNLYNKESYISTVYNNDGTVEKTSLPYFSSNPSSWKSYTYDNYKRPKTVTALGLTTSTVYSNGYATTTYPDGNVEETIHNKTGETTEVSSNNGTVSYHYNAFGRPDIITAYSATTMEYDKYGNQTKLIDPDAGTNDYHYNAFGELTYQKDANNNTFTMLYNNKGQLTNQNCNNTQFSTAYTYYANGMLQKETLGNGNSKEYIYNSLGQLTTLNEKIDGTTYTHEYTYNNRGKVLTYKYPGGYTITNEYDACGYKTGVKAGGSYIWRLSGSDYINEMGQIKEYLLGSNNIKTKREYNSNFELTGINTKKADNTVLFDYTYVFDHSTGNLTSRKDNTRNLTESFGYDTQQRLETAKKNNVSTLSIDYYNNGNIDIKSDAGTYAYLSNKPHAVTQITTTNSSIIHPLSQQITYNPFQKTATIAESSYSYAITYGADRQRKKTVLKNNNAIVETRIYSGLYEKLTAGGSTKELHYIPTPSGTVAIHIKTNGSGGTTYYLLKDYLGSIMKVVDASGNEKEEHSYDAWGNHRNPSNWVLSDFSTTLGIRGYTGHEHLPYFQLVNMNGRMYDPVLGRMLSPDNFVPDATNSQDFNRYTYARNNPLKFIDPTGNKLKWWHWVLIGLGASSFTVDPTTAMTSLGITYASSVATIGMAAGTAQSIDFLVAFYGSVFRKDGTEWSRKRYNNSIRIIGGLFQTDENRNGWANFGILLSRWTWESPQTFAGLGLSHIRNFSGKVDRVDYLGGATFVTSENTGGRKGVTLGNYINMNIDDEITGSFQDRVLSDPLFMHEYGHTIQSRNWGLLYLPVPGLSSLLSADNSTSITDPPFDTHSKFWAEKNANKNAKKYFGKYYDVDWNGTSPYYQRGEWRTAIDEDGNLYKYWYDFTIEDYYPTH